MDQAQALTEGLQTEGALESAEDQISDDIGALIARQREALDRGDDAEIDRLGEQIHQATLRRREVRA